MTDVVQLAKVAREQLATALNALQGSGDVPEELMEVADPIAEAMSVFHRIERSQGTQLDGRTEALNKVRDALDRLQQIDANHPAVDAVMEAVAASLTKARALAKYQPPAPAPQPAPAPVAPAPAPAPVAQAAPAPQAAPPPAAQPAPPAAPVGMHGTLPIISASPVVPVTAAPQPAAPQPVSQAPRLIPVPDPIAVPTPAPAPAPAPYTSPQPAPAPAVQAPVAHQPSPFSAPQASAAPAPQPYSAPQPPATSLPSPFAAPQPSAPQTSLPSPFSTPQASAPSPEPYPSAPAYTPAVSAMTPPVAFTPAPTPEPAKPIAPAAAPKGQVIAVELGTRSSSNFYKGLAGNDVVEHGGVFVATYKIPKIGTSVQLHVLLPGNYEFHATAVVQWVREPRGDGDPGFGARFTDISPEGRQLVYRYARNREPLFYDDL